MSKHGPVRLSALCAWTGSVADVAEQNGDQRTDVDLPWKKGPEQQRGQRDACNADSDKKKG
ncbi:hypothetical protein BHS06_30570 [Myxococcus xanthus]|nr:hypothetical protein BHS06_30570 [Myxococcus xanthus]